MSTQNELMLIAGQAGSKSTFAGGLYHHAQKREDLTVGYDVKYGEKSEFDDKILGRMLSRKEYPEQTRQPYIVEFTIRGKSTLIPETKFDLMDIPGEHQNSAISRFEEGSYDEEQVIEQYTLPGGIRDRIKDDDARLDPKEWEDLYLYRLLRSDKALFLLNLQKVADRNEDPIYSKGTVEKMLTQVEKCALGVTAVDLLGYSPSEARRQQESNGLFGNVMKSLAGALTPQEFDDSLYEDLTDKIPHSASPAVNNLVNTAKMNDEVDLFGLAVPGDNKSGLVREGSDFKTEGFDKVIQWLS